MIDLLSIAAGVAAGVAAGILIGAFIVELCRETRNHG